MNTTPTRIKQQVALRQQAVYVPGDAARDAVTPSALYLARELQGMGYGMSEALVHAVNALTPTAVVDIVQVFNEVMGCDLNWAPLVKGWDTPTGETLADHLVAMVANIYGEDAGFTGTRLPCGHLIPDGTFPLERYNGCPLCGTPFEVARSDYRGQGSKLRVLELWRDQDVERHFGALLASPVALDATQRESLSALLGILPLPAHVTIVMKETRMLVVHTLLGLGREDEAQSLMSAPTDVLRYLWYEHTGSVQVLRPAALIANARRSGAHRFVLADRSAELAAERREKLKLRYSRAWCRRVARWLNEMAMPVDAMCEAMHPRRGMWVRMIRALRMPQMARRPGYDRLRQLLDVFYRGDYTVWQGRVDAARAAMDCDAVLDLLRQRPGVFARSLLATMLWFGPDRPLAAFEQVLSQLPPRLIYTLGSTAQDYFDPAMPQRSVRVATGVTVRVDAPRLLRLYTPAQIHAMAQRVTALYATAMRERYAAAGRAAAGSTIYIDPALHTMPLPVGDRSTMVSDVPAALPGTRFAVEGNAVRLFMQWGKGLPAQHLDMDLSCAIAFSDGREPEVCSYYNLVATGAKHSGDIQRIPDRVGTAEYIELDLNALREAGARYVAFTCNAYSTGNLSPGLTVGWMSSAHPMTVDNETGVAYDPSTVQHMVRVNEENLAKGLVFGVLDVAAAEVVWLEMPFAGQRVDMLDVATLEAMMRKLARKISIGELLHIKAAAQGLTPIDDSAAATECYTAQWALDSAAVAALLLN